MTIWKSVTLSIFKISTPCRQEKTLTNFLLDTAQRSWWETAACLDNSRPHGTASYLRDVGLRVPQRATHCDESMSSLKFTVWNMCSSQSETCEAVWVWTLRNDVAKNTYHSEECLRPYCSPYTKVNSVSAAVTLLIIASSCPFDASSRWLLGTGLRYSRCAHMFWTLLSLHHIRFVFISTEDDNIRLVPQAPARETHGANLLLRGLKDRPFEQFYGDAFHILSYLCAAWSGISQESTRSIC